MYISDTITDNTANSAPVISSVSISQTKNSYKFAVSVTAADDVTAAEDLIYSLRYAEKQEDLESAEIHYNTEFTLSSADAEKTYFYQAAVTDKDGNTVWSEVQSFAVTDFTSPSFNGTPFLKINGRSIKISWDANDNASIANYSVTVNDMTFDSTESEIIIRNLEIGNYNYKITAFDNAGNSVTSGPFQFIIEDNADINAPVISHVKTEQQPDSYIFKTEITAGDDVTDFADLIYQVRYSTDFFEVEKTAVIDGKDMLLAPEYADKTVYYQIGVSDLSGNITWSNIQSFYVKDVTSPVLNELPTAEVIEQQVTISWQSAADNVGVAGYYLSVNGTLYDVKTNSFTLSSMLEGEYTYSITAYDKAGNLSETSAEQTFIIEKPKDKIKPVISEVTLSQSAKDYTFTAEYTASDNISESSALTYIINYSDNIYDLNYSRYIYGKSFTVTPEEAGKTYYYKVGVVDEAGNTAWSKVQSFYVQDKTAPAFTAVPQAVTDKYNVTISFQKADDNVQVAGYQILLNGEIFYADSEKYTFCNLAVGDYTYSVRAYDNAGNFSDCSAPQYFSIKNTLSVVESSVFKWHGNEYLYVIIPNLSKADFVMTETEDKDKHYIFSNPDIFDAEKDTITTDRYIMFRNSCWAAAASNMFFIANWSCGIFTKEDDILKYFADEYDSYTLYKYNNQTYQGLPTGDIEDGIAFLMSGGHGFYNNSVGNDISKYFQSLDCRNHNSLAIAMQKLQKGYAVGMTVGFFDDDFNSRTGGRALTVYGFTYDESKQGTNDYFTGIIVADSDDDCGEFGVNNSNPLLAPDRIKILPIEYNYDIGSYVFSDYGSKFNRIESLQLLAPRPHDIECDRNVELEFSFNENWNSVCSISSSAAAAINGINGAININDDIYIALNLLNSGSKDIGFFTVKAIIDDNASQIFSFDFSKTVYAGTSDSNTIINIGKLDNGVHSIRFEIAGENFSDTFTLNDIFVSVNDSQLPQTEILPFETVENVRLEADNILNIYNNAHAVNTVVGENAVLNIEYGGYAENTIVEANGELYAFYTVSELIVNPGAKVFGRKNANIKKATVAYNADLYIDYGAKANHTTVYGELHVNNGTAKNNTISAGGEQYIGQYGNAVISEFENSGRQYVFDGGHADNNTFNGADTIQYVSGSGSLAVNNTFVSSTQNVSDYGKVKNSVLKNTSIQNLSDNASAENTELLQGAIQNISHAYAYNTTVNKDCTVNLYSGAYASHLTIKKGGNLNVVNSPETYDFNVSLQELVIEYGGNAVTVEGTKLYGKSTVAGTITVNGKLHGAAEGNNSSDAAVYFDFTDRTAEDDYIINDINLCVDIDFNIILDTDTGKYKFSAVLNPDFDAAFGLYDTENNYIGELSLTNELIMNDRVISLENTENGLFVSVRESQYSPFEIPESMVYTSDNCCSWNKVDGASSYIVDLSSDNFKTFMSFTVTDEKISFNNLEQDMQWRVRAAESDIATTGGTLKGTSSNRNEVISMDKNWDYDVIFVNSSVKWDDKYVACHHGTFESWQGTEERVVLNMKTKITDIFEGSSDGNVLILTDSIYGDAIFLEDIYSASPVQEDGARLSRIHEIRAGAGSDIIDLTSRKFYFSSDGVIVRGGDGNDNIWANNGSNKLFGDAGNDRIIGGADNDIIVGGSGNDSMHGGGGEDIFTFCADFGNDVVEQLSGGKVILWFAEGSLSCWDKETKTYSSSFNSVRVTGTDDIELKFGKCDELALDGAFAACTSEKIIQ